MSNAIVSGFALGASLIIAIGAQNAFVLRQGVARDHVGTVVLTCVACDWTLIALGAAGFGTVLAVFPAATAIAAWGGVVFLTVYGGRSFLAAVHPGALREGDAGGRARFASAGAAAAATLAISLLNPHVYLDTVVLLGSVASGYGGRARWAFVAGAGAASLVWFGVLGFGARLLSPLFERPLTWRLLDVGIGVVMWAIAAQLAIGQLAG